MEDYKKYFDKLISLDDLDNYDNPLIQLHFINKLGWEWHIVASDKSLHDDDYLCFGIGNITMEELGMFTLKEIIGMGAELDVNWEPVNLYSVFKKKE